MRSISEKDNRRRQSRTQAVLPVRVRGTDASGASFEALAHTLDLTPAGARLGAIRQEVKAPETLTIFYRQRKKEFTVVWTRQIEGTHEYQVGLQAVAQEREPWGVSLGPAEEASAKASAVSGAA